MLEAYLNAESPEEIIKAQNQFLESEYKQEEKPLYPPSYSDEEDEIE